MKGGLTLLMLIASVTFTLLNAWNAGNMLDSAIRDGQPLYLFASAFALWVCFDLGQSIPKLALIYITERKKQ